MPPKLQYSSELLRPLVEECFNRNYQYKEIVAVLSEKHGITISERTLYRRCQEWGLSRSKDDIQKGIISQQEVRQIIEMETEGENRDAGYRRMKNILQQTHGVVVRRDQVYGMLRSADPEGVEARRKRKLKRRVYYTPGPNHVWSSDGHDKLKPFGIAIYGTIDAWSRKILDLQVHSTNNNPQHIGYYYLNTVKRIGGIPQKTSTDKGSETIGAAAFQVTLYSLVTGMSVEDGMKHHLYTTSPQNQKIECFWSQLMRQKNIRILDEIKDAIELGEYNPNNELQKQLFYYLWIPLVQSIMDRHVAEYNNFKRRPDKRSVLPTGCSANVCYDAPLSHGGQNGLIPVESALVDALIAKEYPNAEELFGILSEEFCVAADGALEVLRVQRCDINLGNVWAIFKELYLELHEEE